MGKLDEYFNRGMGGLIGSTGSYGGLLGDDEKKAANQAAQMALAAQLLDAGGYSDQRVGIGQALGRGMSAASQARQGSVDQSLQSALLRKQMAALDQKTSNEPNSVREYQYAKQNGFEGSFQDWVIAGGQNSRPSAVQEWDFYNKLPNEEKLKYLEMKRNPGIDIKSVGGVPTAIDASRAGGINQTALSSLPIETGAAGAIKQAEAQGGAIGKGSGEIQAGIQKKGSDAVGTKSAIEQAREIIPKATGSAGGAAYDATLAGFGTATEGAKAIAKLKVLQANLMTNMPRMEGPQSDRDVDLYREAAGQIGDPKIPQEIKLEALQTIEELQNRYQERAGMSSPSSPKTPKRVKVDASGKVIQ
jgi:hypothetical protein